MLDLDAITERLKKATPGPWRRGNVATVWDTEWKSVVAIAGDGDSYIGDARDADLIASAPTDIAALVAEVRRLRAAEVALKLYPGCSTEGCGNDTECFWYDGPHHSPQCIEFQAARTKALEVLEP